MRGSADASIDGEAEAVDAEGPTGVDGLGPDVDGLEWEVEGLLSGAIELGRAAPSVGLGPPNGILAWAWRSSSSIVRRRSLLFRPDISVQMFVI